MILFASTILYDSLVICEYLDSLHNGHKLFPASGTARSAALRRHALGYIDFRFDDLGWCTGHDAIAGWHRDFAQRPSMLQSAHVDQ